MKNKKITIHLRDLVLFLLETFIYSPALIIGSLVLFVLYAFAILGFFSSFAIDAIYKLFEYLHNFFSKRTKKESK